MRARLGLGTAILTTVLAAGALAAGCLSDAVAVAPETDGSIPGVDGSLPDAAPAPDDAAPDTGTDATTPHDAALDQTAPLDSAPDAPVDATLGDAAPDAPPDAATDSAPDAPIDAAPDATDAAPDATDAAPDASGDDAGGCPPIVYTLTQIGAGGGHTCALSTDATMLCWGYNNDGQLGMGDTTTRFCPTVGLTGVQQIAVGADFTCALAGGTVYCWGLNSDGQLGQGDTTTRLSPASIATLSNVVSIAAGSLSACALLSDGTVSCWGDNQFGEMGLGTTDGNPHVPTAVPGLSGVTALATGGEFTCALLGNGATIDGGAAASGTLACWGANNAGQLGLGDAIDRHTPTILPSLTNVRQVSAGNQFQCAVLSSGATYCWGANDVGEVGTSATQDAGCSSPCAATPVQVAGVSGASFVSAAVGGSHACVATSGGVLCWGDNVDGNLGIGDASATSSATAVVGGLAGTTSLATGYTQSCALSGDGGLWCWGDNSEGELGLGANQATQFLTPVPVPGL